ncbi:hypothetical protein [Bradyrhizobium sp. Leo170]|uniref:hypothetical protein n=1 Tax=Bradyrhizobium sp. Leo170 TaxID=1571199 RepID=UPI00102E9475|nr:hypothetical protein [Bradyrhizobium sp. Leo170]TAI64161.1 hypothetical protein CWO89_20270 [Bradyrhizobium sp. Leo170]
MRRIATALWWVVTLTLGSVAASHAAPPTVVPSPGYDARLQESRAASRAPTFDPVAPARKPVAPHRAKRTHPR